MGYFISLFTTILLMLIGLLVNYRWYQKHDKNLFRFIADGINRYEDGLFISAFFIALIIIILLLPLLNVLFALSINIALFIKGVD